MMSAPGSTPQQTGFYYRTTIRNVPGSFDQQGNRLQSVALETKLQVPSLPPLRIPGEQSDFVDVMVAYVEGVDKLYVQLRNESKTIQNIADEMNRLYSTLKVGELDFVNPDRGDLCAARYEADGCWYRACVVKKSSMRSIQVFFVDYGNMADVPKTDVKHLANANMRQIPPQAICVKFARVVSTPHSVEKLREALENRNVCIRLESVTKDNDAYIVSMGYDDNGKDVFINDAVSGKVPLPNSQPAASAYLPDDKQQSRDVSNRTATTQGSMQQRTGASQPVGNPGARFGQQAQSTTPHSNFTGGRDSATFGAGGGAGNLQWTNQNRATTQPTNQNVRAFVATNPNRETSQATNQNASSFGAANRANSGGFGGFQGQNRNGNGERFGSHGGNSGGGGGGNFRPQNGTTCFNCNKEGHRANECSEPDKRRPQQMGGSSNFGAAGGASGFGSNAANGMRSGGNLPPSNGHQQTSNFNAPLATIAASRPPIASAFSPTSSSTSAFATPSSARSPPSWTTRAITKIPNHLPVTVGSVQDAIRSDGAITDPDLFYVQLTTSFPKLDECAVSEGKVPLTDVKPGTACVAVFEEDWYRAEIVRKINDSTVEVLFVDFGNTEEKKVTEVFSLTDEQSKMVRESERLAFPCRLAGILPLDANGYSDEAKTLFQQITDNEEATITIKSKSVKGIYEVEMEAKAIGESVAQLLLRKGLARKREFKRSSVIEEERVKIAHCDGTDTAVDRFSVHITSSYDDIDKLADAIKPGTRPLQKATVGELCLAQYEEVWYRGEVTAMSDDNDKVAVLFVDYGNTEWKKPSEVFELDRDEQDPLVTFCSRLSVLCRLKGVCPPNGSTAWSNEAHEKWAELVEEGNELEAIFDKVGAHRPSTLPRPVCVYLKDAMDDEETTVAQQLIHAELAEVDDSDEASAVLSVESDNGSSANIHSVPLTAVHSSSSAVSGGELFTTADNSIDISVDGDTAVENRNNMDDEVHESAMDSAAAGLEKYTDPVVELGRTYDGIRLDAGDGVATPSKFYVLFTKDDNLQAQIGNEIKPGSVPLTNLTPGTPCLATYEDAWYRAELVAVNESDGVGSVLFVDYGNLTTKPLSVLYVLGADQTELIRTTPRLIIPCQLYGIHHKDDWTQEDIAFFNALTIDDSDTDEVKDKVLTVFVTSETKGTYEVLLKDKDTDVSLSKQLIDANIAAASSSIAPLSAVAVVEQNTDAQSHDDDSLDNLLEEELEGVDMDDADETVSKTDLVTEAVASISVKSEQGSVKTDDASHDDKDVLQSGLATDDDVSSIVSDQQPASLNEQANISADSATVPQVTATAEEEEATQPFSNADANDSSKSLSSDSAAHPDLSQD
uniref:Uncharacterized protein n=1 Tax=Plectus sambesii TaxID=2011161 RepID=A0A914UT74_9BILA